MCEVFCIHNFITCRKSVETSRGSWTSLARIWLKSWGESRHARNCGVSTFALKEWPLLSSTILTIKIMRKEKTNKIKKLTDGIKSMTREDLIERRMRIVEAFSAEDLKNPITRQSVKDALANIDTELAKKK